MHRRSIGIQGMVFGGIMAGILLLFALIPFLNILLPVPLVLVFVRYGPRAAVMTAVISALLTAMFLGPIQAFQITVPGGILPGLALGFGFRRKLKPIVTGLLTVAIFFGGFAANYVVARVAVFGGQDPLEMGLKSEWGQTMLNRNIDAIENYINQQKPSSESQKAAIEQQRAMIAEIRKDPVAWGWATLPMGLFFMGAILTWTHYTLCRFMLPRFGHEVPRPSPFSQLRMSPWLIIPFLVSAIAIPYLGNSIVAAPWWVKVLINVASPLNLIIALFGLSVAYGWLRIKQNVSKPAAIGLSLVPVLLMGANGVGIYTMLAMWDSIFDFRGLGHGIWKRRPPEETP